METFVTRRGTQVTIHRPELTEDREENKKCVEASAKKLLMNREDREHEKV